MDAIEGLPAPVLHYIYSSPIALKAYQNLISSSKKFFMKKKIIPVGYVQYDWKGITVMDGEEDIENYEIAEGFKLWIHDTLHLLERTPGKGIYFLQANVYQCQLQFLDIQFQKMTLNEFEFLTKSKSIRKLYLRHSTVTNSVTGEKIGLEQVMKNLPFVEHVALLQCFDFPSLTTESQNAAIEVLSECNHLKDFDYSNIPETFNFEIFAQKLNMKFNGIYSLSFVQNLSDDYRKNLQDFVDEIASDAGNAPMIMFNGQSEESFQKLEVIRAKNFEENYEW